MKYVHYQVKSKEEKAKEPLAIGGNTTVADVYAYEPMPEELSAEEQKFILGAQANVWTEYMKDFNTPTNKSKLFVLICFVNLRLKFQNFHLYSSGFLLHIIMMPERIEFHISKGTCI